MTQAENCLKQMEIEIASRQINDKRASQQKIRKYKKDLDTLQKKRMNLEETYLNEKNKEQLLGVRIDINDNSTKDHEKFLSG